MREYTLEEIVFDALDNAVCNGYGDFVFDSPAEEVAHDLVMYEKRTESYEPETLIPYIEEWKIRRTKPEQ